MVVERGRSGTGWFRNMVSVPKPLRINKQNDETRVLLINRGWFVEVGGLS